MLQDKIQTVNSETLLIVNSISFRLRLINIFRTSCSLIFTLKSFAQRGAWNEGCEGNSTGVSVILLLRTFNNHQMKNKKRTKFSASTENEWVYISFSLISFMYGKIVNCVYILRQKINRKSAEGVWNFSNEIPKSSLLFPLGLWVGKTKKFSCCRMSSNSNKKKKRIKKNSQEKWWCVCAKNEVERLWKHVVVFRGAFF